MAEIPWKPSKEQLLSAYGSTVFDIIAPRLKVLFVGINPGLYSGAVHHHFAKPGNRFWITLYRSGFTDRLLSPFEENELLKRKIGITNIVQKATASASELSRDELIGGAKELEKKVLSFKPEFVAFVGIGAYRIAFGRVKAKIGLQEEKISGCKIWVLPNPSGINANYQIDDLVKVFRELYNQAIKD
jgi:TDG/mug DNA glycosylase family protein